MPLDFIDLQLPLLRTSVSLFLSICNRSVETELQQLLSPNVRKTIDEALRQGWLKSRTPSNAALISLLLVELHAGEAEAIALALEVKASWLLMDERDGRRMARQLALPVTGVLGVLLRAKKRGEINAVRPEI